MPRRESHLHGLLIVDKPGLPQVTANLAAPDRAAVDTQATTASVSSPRLYTSHDIVQIVRRWSGQRRIGHTGTLDPMASGLLVLCLGQATRLVEYYQGHDKVYYAEVTLGRATATYDKMGEVVAEAEVPLLSTAAIEIALAGFRGAIMQQPPIYSALKQDGESLHYKARRGEVVAVTARPVTIYALDLVDFMGPDRIILRVHCSAGTYIRSLAHDLGQALGTYGHLSLLRREAAGAFTLAQAHELSVLEAAAHAGTLTDLLLPVGYGLTLPRIVLDPVAALRLGQGQKVKLPATSDTLLITALDDGGHCLGILRALEEPYSDQPQGERLWKAEKWFAAGE